jgi:hypothetical protein
VGADDISPCSIGQLLVAHPLSVMRQKINFKQRCFDRSVMLVIDADVGGFVHAISLNMLARGTLRSVLAAWSCRSGDGGTIQIDKDDKCLMEALEPLLDTPMLSGGDHMASSLSKSITWLHTLGPAVPGATEVAPSVWLGGDLGVMAGLVASGQAPAERIRPILGRTRWPAAQLQLELQRGAWVRARMVAPELSRHVCMPVVHADDFSEQSKHRENCWRMVMKATGLAGLSDFPRGRGVDDVIQTILHEHYRDMRFTSHSRSDAPRVARVA